MLCLVPITMHRLCQLIYYSLKQGLSCVFAIKGGKFLEAENGIVPIQCLEFGIAPSWCVDAAALTAGMKKSARIATPFLFVELPCWKNNFLTS